MSSYFPYPYKNLKKCGIVNVFLIYLGSSQNGDDSLESTIKFLRNHWPKLQTTHLV